MLSECKLGDAVRGVQNEFVRIKDHLDWLLKQVHELASVDDGVNAISCHQQLQQLQKRIGIVSEKHRQIVKRRQKVMTEVVKVTLRNHELLNRIRGQCQMATSGIPENVLEDFADAASCFQGNPLSPGGSSGASPDASMARSPPPPPSPPRPAPINTVSASRPPRPSLPGPNKRRRAPIKGAKQKQSGSPRAARGKKRKSDHRRSVGSPRKKKSKQDATAIRPPGVRGISEAMFNDIPQYTRGRVKLAALNETYKKLHAIYMEESVERPAKSPVTYKQLGAKGLKLTSASGKNIINCLRNLKLVTVKGNSVTLPEPFHPPL